MDNGVVNHPAKQVKLSNDQKTTPKIMNQLVDELLQDIDFNEFADEQSNDLLDLSTWKRCIVDDVQYENNTQILTGHEAITEQRMLCRLQHAWVNSKISVGDVISLIAVWNDKLQAFCISNAYGFIVIRPDLLVSGTTVLSGLFCMRKAVLADRFKGIEAAMRIVSSNSLFFSI